MINCRQLLQISSSLWQDISTGCKGKREDFIERQRNKLIKGQKNIEKRVGEINYLENQGQEIML